MREFTENQQAVLALDDISGFFLVKTVVGDTEILETTAGRDIEIPSLGLFIADSGLLTVEAPRLSKAVDRETYKIVYVDPNFEKRSLFEAGLTGAPVSVYLCLINTTGGFLGSFANGEPLTDLEDLIVVYSGVVDTQGYSVDPNEGKVIAVMECSSPMAALNMSRPFMTSKDAMRQVSATDTAFDNVFVGSKKISYLWGKA
jgi:hypothetical protein